MVSRMRSVLRWLRTSAKPMRAGMPAARHAAVRRAALGTHQPWPLASTVLANGYGWCVPKAALLTAACRAAGIPARMGFADVRNHLSTERMRETMKTDLFIWHGYTDIWLDGAWRKATPAFNIELCERFGLLPLEFDGENDSIYHPFDKSGARHMEYVHQRGTFDDMPLAQIVADFRTVYSGWLQGDATRSSLQDASFANDIEKEARY